MRTSLLKRFQIQTESTEINDGDTALSPYTIYRVTSYLQLLALSILTCNQNMNFLARLVSDICRNFGESELGALSPSNPEEKNFCMEFEFCALDLTQLYYFRDINGVPKLRA